MAEATTAEGGMRAGGVGADIRALRKARGLTLTALAHRIGRSVGWISEVERGITDPAIADLGRIAEVLEQPVSLFFAGADAPEEERGHVVRVGRRRILGSARQGLREELLSPDLTGSFEIVRSVFDPGATLTEPAHRRTEEAGYVVSGRFELEVGGRRFALGPGDSFRIKDEPFRWRNPGREPAVVIWVIAPPVY